MKNLIIALYTSVIQHKISTSVYAYMEIMDNDTH